MSLAKVELYAVAAGAAVLGLVVWRASAVAGQAATAAAGYVSGNNPLTETATNAAGEPIRAYIGVPVIGTLGAGANALSGGYLASFGEWLGSKAYDVFHTDPVAPVTEDPNQSAAETQRLIRQNEREPDISLPYTVSPNAYMYGVFGWGPM